MSDAIAPMVPDDLDLDGDGVEGARSVGFVVDTEERAAWALSRLLAFDDEAARLEDGYARCVADLESRRKSAVEFFGPMLEAWFKKNPPKKKNTKSRKLLTGVVGTKTVGGEHVIKDERAALAWAREKRPDLVRTTILAALDKVATKALAAKSEEPIPGVVFEPEREQFYFKSHKAKGDSDG
jgi:hypothetical protein